MSSLLGCATSFGFHWPWFLENALLLSLLSPCYLVPISGEHMQRHTTQFSALVSFKDLAEVQLKLLGPLSLLIVHTLITIHLILVFFLHERGTKMSIYTFFLASGSSFGPLINGWIGEKLSIQWFWWVC